ncbi:MAG: ATP-dependent DNA helicase [Vicinamibacterales bacterium]
MPQVPAVSGLAGLTAAAFEPSGALARALPDFEPRAGQAEMAGRVAHVFERGGVLLAEAGTGTGKTLAYLVPAILSRQRVLVSTGTKNLQEQIYLKDIPTLQQALSVPFTVCCMKGRANYLCLHRLEQVSEGSGDASREIFLPMVQAWATRTESGDRAELEDLPEDLPFWNEVSATAETCLGTECPRYEDCFVTRMRRQAAASDVVIVNHHLLCADASVRRSTFGEVIPACSHAVVDEAHQLEDVATQYFGVAVSTFRLEEIARDVERLLGSGIEGLLERARIQQTVDRVRDHARAFFADLAAWHRSADRFGGEQRVRATSGSLERSAAAAGELTASLERLQSVLAGLQVPSDAGEKTADAAPLEPAALARRAGEIRDELRFLLRAEDAAFVYFVELRGRGVFLRAAPIDVSAIIHDLLLDRMRATVLTSATLTVDGRFDYIRGRLGVGDAEEIRLPSEFDYATQTLLYLPPRMPDPREPGFALAAGRQVIELLKRSRGRAFVLFTSYATLRAVQAVAELALDFPMFVQGTAPRSQLLKQFRETPHSVLFATSSFWQGVDVAGDALSCVVIDKLPFASPGDPVTAARIDAIRAAGGEPFSEYQVPLAVLTLQQGLGRLIRHRRDRGVLAVLDPRLRTKTYGRRFLASLPPAPIVQELAAVEAFYSML